MTLSVVFQLYVYFIAVSFIGGRNWIIESNKRKL